MARSLTYASIAAYWLAEYDQCIDLALQAVQLQSAVGDVISVTYSRDTQGMALVRLGRYDEGVAILEECATTFQEIGDRSGVAIVLAQIGHVAYLRQEFGRSLRSYREALGIARDIGDRRRMAFCLEGFGMALAQLAVAEPEAGADGEALARAVTIFAGAETLRQRIRSPLPASERSAYETCRALAAAHLPAPVYAAAWERGRATTPDQVVGLVL